MSLTAVPIAVAGALFIAAGFVVQQHVAAQQPDEERLSFRLLVHLARRPLWLAGIGTMAIGQLLGAAALGQGDLALVTPIMAINLVFALSMSAMWRHCRLGVQEWAGAVALLAGLTGFIAAGNPHGGASRDIGVGDWAAAGGSVALVACALVLAAKRYPPPEQATLLAGAAGTLYGFQDALTTRTIAQTGGGALHFVTTWPVYALLAVAVTALMLGQSAFEAAPLDASLPAITAAEPITAIALGAGVFGEHLNMAPALLVAEVIGLGAMVVGVYLVASSPVVTGKDDRAATARPDDGGGRARAGAAHRFTQNGEG